MKGYPDLWYEGEKLQQINKIGRRWNAFFGILATIFHHFKMISQVLKLQYIWWLLLWWKRRNWYTIFPGTVKYTLPFGHLAGDSYTQIYWGEPCCLPNIWLAVWQSNCQVMDWTTPQTPKESYLTDPVVPGLFYKHLRHWLINYLTEWLTFSSKPSKHYQVSGVRCQVSGVLCNIF